MYKQVEFSIQSISPLIMHDGKKQTNPLHPLTKEIKRFSSKKPKTEEDLLSLAKLEWLGGLYVQEMPKVEVQGGNVRFTGGKGVCIPSDVLEAMLINGAKKRKLGTQFKSGILIDQDFLLEYDGSKDIESLWNDGRFTDTRPVRVQKNAVMRCRPIFPKWGLTFTVNYLPSSINKDQIQEALETAGIVAAIGDNRPKYGRFVIA